MNKTKTRTLHGNKNPKTGVTTNKVKPKKRKTLLETFSRASIKTILVLVYVFGIALPLYHVLWYTAVRGKKSVLLLTEVRNQFFFLSLIIACLLNVWVMWIIHKKKEAAEERRGSRNGKGIRHLPHDPEEEARRWESLQNVSLFYFFISFVAVPGVFLFAKILIEIIRPLF